MPKLFAHLQSKDFNINFLVTKWFICLFTNVLPLEVELSIWDIFLINGVSVLFRAALTLFQLMREELLKAKDICDIQITVQSFMG